MLAPLLKVKMMKSAGAALALVEAWLLAVLVLVVALLASPLPSPHERAPSLELGELQGLSLPALRAPLRRIPRVHRTAEVAEAPRAPVLPAKR